MFLRQITDDALAQNAYLIGCQRTGEAVIIDPERDIDRYLQLAAENGLRVTAVAETHIHADYLSGARELLEHHGVTSYLSAEGGPDWQFEWAQGHPRAVFLRGGDSFRVGNIELQALLTAGHTPEHLSFLVTDHGGGATEPLALLSGDFLFVGDAGRPDLLESAAGQAGAMEPGARTLYHSLRATGTLPDHLQILPAHGAGSACGKALGAIPSSVLGYERKFNPALRSALEGGEEAFVREILSGQPEPPLYFARMKRDNKAGPALLPGGRLPAPRRLAPAELPALAGSGVIFLDLRPGRAGFAAAHLAGSLFAPLAGGKLPIAAGSYVPEDARIVLLVNDAAEVDPAVRQLIRIGLDRIEAWIPAAEALAAGPSLTRRFDSLTTEQLAAALQAHPGAAVLDVRSASEFEASHVRGAKHIAYTRLAARLAEVPDATPLYVHCGSGLRAAIAGSLLEQTGRPFLYVDGPFESIAAAVLEKPQPPSA